MSFLLFSPIGKIVTAVLLAVILAGGLYMRVKSDAEANLRSRLQAEELKRLGDAVRAGDAVDVSGDRLLADDGHRRD